MYSLYPYQENIVDDLRKEITKYSKVLIYAPTGAGKTIISKHVIHRMINRNKKVLFVTPRIKLSLQTRKSFGFGNLILGEKTKSENSLCTIASLQSLYSRKIKEHFDFIFIDECHFAHGSKYQKYIFKTFSKSKIIGLSATPIDENGYLLQGYESIINRVSVKQLINQKFLTDVEVWTTKTPPKTENIPIVNGDYNQTEASKVVSENEVISNALAEWKYKAYNLKTLVFACDIEHAEKLELQFLDLDVKVKSVHSKLSEKQIETNYKLFADNEIQIFINVDMATFGFDQPDIECLLFVRPIKSLRLYKQMIGRGIRKSKGKTSCLILDCANVVLDNGYPTDDINFTKKPVVNKTIDKLANVERETSGEIKETVKKERVEYLQKIGKLVDLYANKEYAKEQELVDDVKKVMERAGYYFWRQNSGIMYENGRYIHFTDKKGLPDITLIYNSVYIGLELKLKNRRFTKNQKETLPEFSMNKVCFFVVENVVDLFNVLEHIQKNIIQTNEGIFVKNELFEDNERQKKLKSRI